MKLKYNRFAAVPVLCYKCKRYVWLEPYRRAEIVHFSLNGCFSMENICKECFDKYYDTGEKQDEGQVTK